MQKNLGKIKRTVEEYVVLTVATLILVVGVYVFKFPNNFSFGGVTGLAVVLGAVLPTSPGNLTFIINMLLLVLGFIFLGRGFGVKTVYVSVLTSVGLSFAERVFPMDAPLTGQPVLTFPASHFSVQLQLSSWGIMLMLPLFFSASAIRSDSVTPFKK